jgi:uncharacterized lipoprotein YmbA
MLAKNSWFRAGQFVLAGAALAALGLAASGCGTLVRPREDPTRYFLLNPAPPAEMQKFAIEGRRPLNIGIRRPEIASYLNTPLIVVRDGPAQVDFSGYHRWGESLAQSMARVLRSNLAALPWTQRVATFPTTQPGDFDFEIGLDVLALEGFRGVEGAGARLEVEWRLYAGGDRQPLDQGRFLRQPDGWDGRDYAALALLLREASAELAAELAQRIQNLAVSSPSR